MLIIALAGALQAANIRLSPDGSDKNDGLSWQTAKRTLQSAVQSAAPSGTIMLKSGAYKVSGEIEISKDIKIIGGFDGTEEDLTPLGKKPSSISGKGKNRIFCVKGSSLEAENITFQKGAAKGGAGSSEILGGAILLENAQAEFKRCSFQNNSAANSKKSSAKALGGAIAATKESKLIAESCVFESNSAASKNYFGAEGGAIYADETSEDIEIKGCRFIKNKAGMADAGSAGALGGAVRMSGGRISSCEFEKNSAAQKTRGGAYYLIGGESQISGANGGAVFAEPNLMPCSISESRFLQNSASGASGMGGAVGIYTPKSAAAEVKSNIFFKNSADCGGAVSIKAGAEAAASVSACRFDANSADCGGAIALSHPPAPFELPPIHIMNIGVLNAQTGEVSETAAAATAPIEIVNSAFENNRAENGAAIYFAGFAQSSKELETYAQLYFCTFLNNCAKGGYSACAVYLNGILDASSCIFSDGANQPEIMAGRNFIIYSRPYEYSIFDPTIPRAIEIRSALNIRNCIVPAEISLPQDGSFPSLSKQNIKIADPQFLGLRTEGAMSAFVVKETSPANDFDADETINIESDIFGSPRGKHKPTIGAAQFFPSEIEAVCDSEPLRLNDGEKFTLSAEAAKYTGKLSYQWFEDSGAGFAKINSAKNSITLKASAKIPERAFKCLISDESGASAFSPARKVYTYPKLKITKDISYKGSSSSSPTTLSVEAQGCDLSFRWQIFENGEWKDLEETSAMLTIESPQNGARYRAVVSSPLAKKPAISREIKIKILPQPEFSKTKAAQEGSCSPQKFAPMQGAANETAGEKTLQNGAKAGISAGGAKGPEFVAPQAPAENADGLQGSQILICCADESGEMREYCLRFSGGGRFACFDDGGSEIAGGTYQETRCENYILVHLEFEYAAEDAPDITEIEIPARED